jgi:hypothetical protein
MDLDWITVLDVVQAVDQHQRISITLVVLLP